ncbi:MAG TPA: glycosyltransferase family 2 protein [Bacilli bacterium]
MRVKRRHRRKSALRSGYHAAAIRGYDAGFAKGYAAGITEGKLRYAQNFPGTSIIIPTFNQRDRLRQCLQSIAQFTDLPHEVIVIDNASSDGTQEFLREQRTQLVYVRNAENRGFSGAVNRGLKLARGETIVILNDDTIVTERWLDNLLHCLLSDERIGLVGPVTNYISGSQQIDVAYHTNAEMCRFAADFNRTDSSRWRETDRLAGFCLAMTKGTFQRLGYFDEGFELGNCEDDDYGLRARICGLKLMIAGDTFIHHAGSATVKSLGEQFAEAYRHNLDYYSAKWGNVGELLDATLRNGQEGGKIVDFYPTCVFVQGPNRAVYWLENGVRHHLADVFWGEAVRISAVELRMMPEGPPLSWEQAAARLTQLHELANEPFWTTDGALCQTPDGAIWQICGAALRKVTVPLALSAWKLLGRPIKMLDDHTLMSILPQGRPILPPTVLVEPEL